MGTDAETELTMVVRYFMGFGAKGRNGLNLQARVYYFLFPTMAPFVELDEQSTMVCIRPTGGQIKVENGSDPSSSASLFRRTSKPHSAPPGGPTPSRRSKRKERPRLRR